MGEILKPWWRIYVLSVLKSLWRKFLKRGSNGEQSVGPFLPFLSAWESEPVSLSSYLGERLNLGLAKGKGALLRSKVSGEVLSWPFHPSRPWLCSHVSLLCGWSFGITLDSRQLLWFFISWPWLLLSLPRGYLGPLLLPSGWPLLLPVHLPEGAFWVQSSLLYSLQVPVVPNTEDWRPYVAMCPSHPDSKSPFQNSLLPTPCTRSSSHVKILTVMRQPHFCHCSCCFFCLQGPSPHFPPGEILQIKYHLAPVKSYRSPMPTLAGSNPSSAPLWLCLRVIVFNAPSPVPHIKLNLLEGERVLYLLSKASCLGAECMTRSE